MRATICHEEDIKVVRVRGADVWYAYLVLLERAFFWPCCVAAKGEASFMPSLQETAKPFVLACFFGRRTKQGLAFYDDFLAAKIRGGLNWQSK
jgi:hypothetical protein